LFLVKGLSLYKPLKAVKCAKKLAKNKIYDIIKVEKGNRHRVVDLREKEKTFLDWAKYREGFLLC